MTENFLCPRIAAHGVCNVKGCGNCHPIKLSTQPTREERCCQLCWDEAAAEMDMLTSKPCKNPDCSSCHNPAPQEAAPTPNREVEDWEKEAREIVSQVCCDGQYVNQSISFIRNLLAAHRSQLLSSIRGEIEGMKKQEFWVKGIAEGYKQALDDILSLPDLSPDL